MDRLRRPVLYGLASALGVFVGGVVLGNYSVKAGSVVAATAFVVGFVLMLLFK